MWGTGFKSCYQVFLFYKINEYHQFKESVVFVTSTRFPRVQATNWGKVIDQMQISVEKVLPKQEDTSQKVRVPIAVSA